MTNARILIEPYYQSKDEFVKWITDSTCIHKISLPTEHYDHMLMAAHFINGINSPLVEIGYYAFDEDIEFVTFSTKTKARLKELYPKEQPVNENAVLRDMVKDLEAKNERLELADEIEKKQHAKCRKELHDLKDKFDVKSEQFKNLKEVYKEQCEYSERIQGELHIEKKQHAKYKQLKKYFTRFNEIKTKINSEF